MIEVHREREGHRSIPVFDALWPGVTKAWQTVGDGSIQPVTTNRAWVSLSIPGKPPETDTEVIQMAGLDPNSEGLIRVLYLEESPEETFTILKWSLTTPAQRENRWGMLVLQFADT